MQGICMGPLARLTKRSHSHCAGRNKEEHSTIMLGGQRLFHKKPSLVLQPCTKIRERHMTQIFLQGGT